uniref:Uncharacterized protein n=1 Tax=Meloidogyne enterolobii TaxID=390850 RepID=A0A6V7UVB4_MELEN|nr:unnamed protein product [Meloidogyne enterolobii]
MFDQRILQNASSACYYLKDGPYDNDNTPVTNEFCKIINTLQLRVNACRNSFEAGEQRYYKNFHRFYQFIRHHYYNKRSIFQFDCDETRIKNKIYKILNPDVIEENWGINERSQSLNDHIAALLEKSVKSLKEYKNAKRNKKYFTEFDFNRDVIKQHVIDYDAIDGLLVEIMENACEIQYGVSRLCEQGGPVNCYSIKGSLSMFAVELFVTAIEVDGFDFLLGKWPFHIFRYQVEENVNQQDEVQQQIP